MPATVDGADELISYICRESVLIKLCSTYLKLCKVTKLFCDIKDLLIIRTASKEKKSTVNKQWGKIDHITVSIVSLLSL